MFTNCLRTDRRRTLSDHNSSPRAIAQPRDSYTICQATYCLLYYTDRLSSLQNANRGNCRLVASPKTPETPLSTKVNPSDSSHPSDQRHPSHTWHTKPACKVIKRSSFE
ncbi:hypothetical protein DPMN_194331 [Dreissena polymorpha]|uniref:Uncharacterized protein n=1 Tax=Dreissena polymorpha TaxID=45954 RepID=A0A9D3Y661_DREPO|nr:hypothetical protein DPMN_194331 [Dreissena polymorpha]